MSASEKGVGTEAEYIVRISWQAMASEIIQDLIMGFSDL
jgi:hypothetical protein